MSTHAQIVVKGRGHFEEGTLASGQTPKPGMAVTLKSDGTWEVYNRDADGDNALMAIVVENFLLGGLKTTAYADGAHFHFYIPQAGDELQVLVSDTEDLVVIGDLLIPDDGTGEFIETTGTPEIEPFTALEALGTIAADTHCLVKCNG